MIPFVADLFRGLTPREGLVAAVDVLVVAYVIYRALRMVKGTRGAQMLIGLALVGGGFFVAKLLELTTLSWLLDNLINYSIIFLIVIFQNDIRRGLVRVGANVFAPGRHSEETATFEEIVKAAERLAEAKMGGLIVIERDANLEEFFRESGVVVDARVTKELLCSLFIPDAENDLHDGAVTVKNLRVHRAGCVLPLSSNSKLDKMLGTRHRAAIGITEETDAVVVVVSEERGTISLCFGGNIARDLDGATLRKALLSLFQKEKRILRRERSQRRRSDPLEQTQRLPIPGLRIEPATRGAREPDLRDVAAAHAEELAKEAEQGGAARGGVVDEAADPSATVPMAVVRAPPVELPPRRGATTQPFPAVAPPTAPAVAAASPAGGEGRAPEPIGDPPVGGAAALARRGDA